MALRTRYSGCPGFTLSLTSLLRLVSGHCCAGKLLGLTRKPDRRAICILGAWFRLHVLFRSRSVLWPTNLVSAFSDNWTRPSGTAFHLQVSCLWVPYPKGRHQIVEEWFTKSLELPKGGRLIHRHQGTWKALPLPVQAARLSAL